MNNFKNRKLCRWKIIEIIYFDILLVSIGSVLTLRIVDFSLRVKEIKNYYIFTMIHYLSVYWSRVITSRLRTKLGQVPILVSISHNIDKIIEFNRRNFKFQWFRNRFKVRRKISRTTVS